MFKQQARYLVKRRQPEIWRRSLFLATAIVANSLTRYVGTLCVSFANANRNI